MHEQALIMVITSQNICTILNNYRKCDYSKLNAITN